MPTSAASTVEDERRLKDAVRDKNIVVGVLAVPAASAQKVCDDLVDAGVRIIFNYSEGLLDVPSNVTVHTSNPAVELLHALYFHLAWSARLGPPPMNPTIPSSPPSTPFPPPCLPRLFPVRPRLVLPGPVAWCGSFSGTATCSAGRDRTSTPARSRASGATRATTSSSSRKSARPSSGT